MALRPDDPTPDPAPTPRPVECPIDPPDGTPGEGFTVWLLPFGRGETSEYLVALAAVADLPGEWARERCRRLAERIVRWDVEIDGRPVGVSGAAVARLPAWALPRIETALLAGLTGDDE